jgi:uncharacterized protein
MQAQSTLNYIVKIASRCNLNCSYCYVYNQADTSWRSRPAMMSDDTFAAMVDRIHRHCSFSDQRQVRLAFHGGEPTLVGPVRFGRMCAEARDRLAPVADVQLSIQTNGTRLNREWLSVVREYGVSVSVSLDGPPEINDKFRVDRRGRGSYAAVARGIEQLKDASIPFGILSVVQPGADPLAIHSHFLALEPASLSYLLPSYTHDTVAPIREQFGPTPCADFLLPIFDEWFEDRGGTVAIREFWNLCRLVLGGKSRLDTLGNPPLRFVCVETDGSLQGLDKLRSCEDGLSDIGLNVLADDFAQIAAASPFHAAVMEGLPLPTACRACPERDTCAGGHLPNRYSAERLFDNPSVWCADLLALFAHARAKLGVAHDETRRRRAALERVRNERELVAQVV